MVGGTVGATRRLYDTSTPVPTGGGNFTLLGRASPSGDHVAFYAQGAGQEGLYTDLTGLLTVVANQSTPVPGEPGRVFIAFGDVQLDGNTVAFQGSSSGGGVGVFAASGGVLRRVISSGDQLDGRTVEFAFFGPQGLDGNTLATYVYFTNGERGIYKATRSCYPDCDGDGALTLADFGCFQTKFAKGNMEADCNSDAYLNLADFGCFQTRFALGCP